MNMWNITNILWSLSLVQQFDEIFFTAAFKRMSELFWGQQGQQINRKGKRHCVDVIGFDGIHTWANTCEVLKLG